MRILQTVINLLFISYGVYCSDMDFAFPKNMIPNVMFRIIGGQIVSPPNLYPSQALLGIKFPTRTDMCGGSLIKPDWILTAAHCVDGNVKQINVHLGLHDMSKDAEETRQLFTTNLFVIHPGWNKKTFTNDLALIKLPREAELNENVNIITLATGNDTFSSKVGVTIGWGLTETGVLSTRLRSSDVTILSNEECVAINAAYSIITNRHLCTNGEGPVGTCVGDSGGPLIVEKHLVGVISFGPTNCIDGYPSVYTRLTEYSNWVNYRMKRGISTSTNLRFNNVLAVLSVLLSSFFQSAY